MLHFCRVPFLVWRAALRCSFFEGESLQCRSSGVRAYGRFAFAIPDQGVEQSASPSFATVQEGGGYPLADFLIRDELIRGFESLGYELIDFWQIAEPEHYVVMTCYPDRSVKAYSGLFLRLNEPGNARLVQGREDRAAVLPTSA